MPARVYKYQAFTAQTLAALKVRTLWFGSPSRLNDPFDCAVPWRLKPVSTDDCMRVVEDHADPRWQQLKSDRRFIDGAGRPTALLVQAVEKAGRDLFATVAASHYAEVGVTCFSETPDSALLWSHYAGGHRGLCLEFDTASPQLEKLHKVMYTDELPELSVVDVMFGDSPGVIALLLTKAACWSYEREWRAIHRNANTEYCYGVESLLGLYLGAALGKSEIDLVCHILHGTPTKLYQVKRSSVSFGLEIESIQYTPFQYSAN